MPSEIQSAIFGYAKMHEEVHKEFKSCFDVLPGLAAALTEVINAAYPNPTQLQHVVLKLGELSTISLLESITLLGNGMGQGAFKLLRSMLEYGINAEYLRRYPEEVALFLDWHWVEQFKHLRYMKESMPTAYAMLSPDLVQQTDSEFKRVFPEFERSPGSGKLRGTWSTLDLASRSIKADLQEHYRLVYPLASALFHGSVAGLSYYYEPVEDQHRLTLPPSMKWCGQSLIGGHALGVEMLKTLCLAADKTTTPSAARVELALCGLRYRGSPYSMVPVVLRVGRLRSFR